MIWYVVAGVVVAGIVVLAVVAPGEQLPDQPDDDGTDWPVP